MNKFMMSLTYSTQIVIETVISVIFKPNNHEYIAYYYFDPLVVI